MAHVSLVGHVGVRAQRVHRVDAFAMRPVLHTLDEAQQIARRHGCSRVQASLCPKQCPPVQCVQDGDQSHGVILVLAPKGGERPRPVARHALALRLITACHPIRHRSLCGGGEHEARLLLLERRKQVSWVDLVFGALLLGRAVTFGGALLGWGARRIWVLALGR